MKESYDLIDVLSISAPTLHIQTDDRGPGRLGKVSWDMEVLYFILFPLFILV